ncbi:hypothetical protein [Peribacillus simplex]|uniref:hypothetical protein n=1 Tax=Peribacillus simplex TaxID=1478 RepID=UPI0024C15F52|nr:hypothetical protein [Peribacillus simplex]WHY56212.1 hypothetical protein QNH43_24295 [Peribacillus simplex]
MTNPNHVQNGGFEQSSPPALPPFWSGSGETQSGGTQLLGDNNARLLTPGETITQTLLPLQAGEQYQFQAAFSTSAGAGTIDVDITGISTRTFQALRVPGDRYAFYNFDFIATGTTASLIITNNSDADLRVDVVSVKLTNPNHVQNGGFEQSSPPALPPFWSGSGDTQSGGSQLLGNNSALLAPGETITQTLLPLQAGEQYQFLAAFASAAGTGTIDVDIIGEATHKFQAANVSGFFTFYNFNFIAAGTTASLIITNNSNGNLSVDVVSVKLTNPNHVQNGGFEQSSPPALPPFWSGSGETQSGGTQLLGDNNARLLTPGETITQTLLPLQAGEQYQFQAAFSTSAGAGTIDVDITGISTRAFQADNVSVGVIYTFYNFDFIAAGTTASLIITNNSNADLRVDVVSVKLA